MIPMLFFGIAGGVLAAFFAWPYGFLSALSAYVIVGSLCALIPGMLQVRAEARKEAERDLAASGMEPSPVGEET
jgi:hypothetical protein